MILLIQAAPLLLLALLLSGRAGPVPAVLAALILAVPAALVSLPEGTAAPAFLLAETLRGAFLAAKPIGVVVGGLLFHAAVAQPATATTRAPEPRRVFTATLLAGSFLESATGFAVGAVFALSALRGMGLGGAPAGALALMALTMVPWGGLGPGTALGAALIGVPAQALAGATAWPNAAWMLLLAPVFWRICAAAGVHVPLREKIEQLALLALMGILLILGHALLPFEVVGLFAAGIPLLAMLWRLDPPGDAPAWRAALTRLAPYLGLTAGLLGARLLPAPSWTPFADLPGFALNHVAVVLWVVAGLLLWLRADGKAAARTALARARKPVVAMLLYVILARLMAGSGASGALAQAAATGLGDMAPYAVPAFGLVSGLVTGSNVGSNAALMPVQAALGAAAGLPALLAPAVHNFAGAAGAGMSFAVTALICGLLGDGTRPAQVWRLLAPAMLAVLGIGWLAIGWPG